MDIINLTGSSKLEREGQDFYPTPPYATHKLLEMEKFFGNIWECACGDGAISKILEKNYDVYSSDLYDRQYGVSGIDFLKTSEVYDNIITNPPYKLAEQFVTHALKCSRYKIALLLKLNFLEGQKRYLLFKHTPLKKILVFSKRLSFQKGTEKSGGSGVLAYAWFIWEIGYTGKPSLDWIL